MSDDLVRRLRSDNVPNYPNQNEAADRIEQLERELAKYKDCDVWVESDEGHPGWVKGFDATVLLGRLYRELARARSDTERLDWLEGKGDPNYDGPPRLNLVTDRWWREDVDVRQAIDAAKGERDE